TSTSSETATPSSPATATATSPDGKSSSSATSTSGTATASAGGSADGQGVYSRTCVACHGAGVAGAPKFGDKAAWAPRIAQGKDTLYQHAINGYTGKNGVMPPKGGNTALSDAEVKAAVDYMVGQAS
ncbi:cytochrome c5 family protein, partial [Ramlibacter aquaticus]